MITQNDDEDGSVDIVVTEEVQVIFCLQLGIGSKPDEDSSDKGEDDVADDHEVLDETLAAGLHLAFLYIKIRFKFCPTSSMLQLTLTFVFS